MVQAELKAIKLENDFYQKNSWRKKGETRMTDKVIENNQVTVNTEFGKVNDGQSESSGNGTTWTTGGRAMLRQRIGLTPGRTFSLFINYSISNKTYSSSNKQTVL